MRKDQFGIALTFYAVMAFVLALLGQVLLLGLLLGFVILVEKDEWLIRQVMQAFFVSLVSGVWSAIVGVFGVITSIPVLGTVVSAGLSFIGGIISLVILVFIIIGLVNVMKGGEAKLPIFNGLAYKAFGMVKNSTTYSTVE